jgi:hypothetical protein
MGAWHRDWLTYWPSFRLWLWLHRESIGWWVSELVQELLRFSCCLLFMWEAGSLEGQFGNSEEWKHPPLEAATEQWLVKTWLLTLVCVIVNSRVQSRAYYYYYIKTVQYIRLQIQTAPILLKSWQYSYQCDIPWYMIWEKYTYQSLFKL